MVKPEISVIIPAYNEGEGIKRTIITLRKQKTSIPYEIIVANNNSTDNTAEIAGKYADKVVLETQQGVAFARNCGIRASQGKYLVHTDADAIFPSDFIEKVYPIFKSEKFVGFTCGEWNFYDGDSLYVKIMSRVYSLFYKTVATIMYHRNVMQLPGWCICTSRKMSEKVGHFVPQRGYLEDVIYSIAIEPYGPKGYFPDIKVNSSVRRLESGLVSTFDHYGGKGASIPEEFRNVFRKSRYNPKSIPTKLQSVEINGEVFTPDILINQ